MTRAEDDRHGDGARRDTLMSVRVGSRAAADPVRARIDTDWRDRRAYAYLDGADRRMFAWEWLRRCTPYLESWRRHRHSLTDLAALRAARQFALVVLENPQSDARDARPAWMRQHDVRCVNARARAPRQGDDAFDVFTLASCARVTIDPNGDEHWSFSDGRWLLRLDIVDGTLLGGPAQLNFRIDGLAALNHRIDPLLALAKLVAPDVRAPPGAPFARTERWISELRAADALGQGATHRMIAEALFGAERAAEWRLDSDAYRLRVQRLTRAAKARLANWVAQEWLG